MGSNNYATTDDLAETCTLPYLLRDLDCQVDEKANQAFPQKYVEIKWLSPEQFGDDTEVLRTGLMLLYLVLGWVLQLEEV